ncbi:hypothetical protein AA958_33010 [Streptomyces sp. CNQ-509]|jgi:hypothetical protein|uniref:hypothetical protein n=1 Tax=unclassified Streptomyces TaxID=2593676 RepID=UPI00062DFA62|nr:hypothetical protein [Streptomyces sp. CNQ-509]AKH86240.1 hypothetical protein AA958_33010 [Streptomyces sp. CNQ-509]
MASKIILLPKEVGSLSRGLPPADVPPQPETLFVLGANGGMSVAPDADFTVVFGRNEPEVHVCVGGGDQHVSRRQGILTRQYARWVLTNTGKRPIRFPDSRLVHRGDQAFLPAGYTPLFVVSPRQDHLLEVRISAARPGGGAGGTTVQEESTLSDERELEDDERLVIVCLAQRYLQGDPQPQPLTWAQVADELKRREPHRNWTEKTTAHIVSGVRRKLSRKGVQGLLAKEVPPPVGNALNHNLITDLLETATIKKEDLSLLGP